WNEDDPARGIELEPWAQTMCRRGINCFEVDAGCGQALLHCLQLIPARIRKDRAQAADWAEVDFFFEQRVELADCSDGALYHVYGRGVRARMTNETSCAGGRAACEWIAFDTEHVGDAALGQVVRCRAADHATTNDDNGSLIDNSRQSTHELSPDFLRTDRACMAKRR